MNWLVVFGNCGRKEGSAFPAVPTRRPTCQGTSGTYLGRLQPLLPTQKENSVPDLNGHKTVTETILQMPEGTALSFLKRDGNIEVRICQKQPGKPDLGSQQCHSVQSWERYNYPEDLTNILVARALEVLENYKKQNP